MPLKRISGRDAVENLRRNPFGRWPARDDDAGVNRVEPLCQPAFTPSFQLDYADKIYTIGSCFARNIEKWLSARGFNVVTASFPNDDPAFVKLGTELLNNYGVTSILNEFRWALDPDHPFDPDHNLFEASPGRFVDLHLVPSVRAAPRDAVLARREAIISVTRRIVDSRIVIITLGLSEVWFDSYSSTYLNYAVPRAAIAEFPDRYELHVLSYEETIGCLREIVALLKRFCRPDQRIVLTVSPVPLVATHTTRDIVVANSYSKSALRVAAEAIEAENDHIDYFPSYESVMLSDRSRAWKVDLVHVQDEIVELNVTRMIGAYAPQVAVTVDHGEISRRMQDAQREIADNNPRAAIQHLEPLKDHLHLDGNAAELYATLCLSVGRAEDAQAAIALAPAKPGDWKRAMLEADIKQKNDDNEGAIEAYLRIAAQEPKRAAPLQRLTDLHHRLGQWDKAIGAAKRWLTAASASSDPIYAIARIYRAKGDNEQADIAYRGAIERSPQNRRYLFDYVEFLIEQARLPEAAAVLARIMPETLGDVQRVEVLRLFLPMEDPSAAGRSEGDRPADPILAAEMAGEARLEAARAAGAEASRIAADLATAKERLRDGDSETALALATPHCDGKQRDNALPIRAIALSRLGRLAEAEETYRALIRSRPDDPGPLGGLARVLSGLGRDPEAIECLERAMAMAPDSLAWPQQLAGVLIGMGAFARAAAIIDEALKANPGEGRLLRLRQRVTHSLERAG